MAQDILLSALVGVRQATELQEDLGAADVELSQEQTACLDRASRAFWSTMRNELELWVPENSYVREELESTGVAYHEWDYYRGLSR